MPLFLNEEKECMEDPTVLVNNDNQIRILCALNECFPGGLKATQISDAAHIHRSTVSVNSNELLELGLIEKSIVPGTENHINPTLLFRLSESFKDKVQAFLAPRIKAQPELWAVYPPESCPKQFAQPSTLEDVETTEDYSEVSQQTPKSFEEQVKQGFKIMAERMLAMQREIDELKQRLNEKPHTQTDLSEVFDIFESFDAQSNQGVK